MQGLITLDFGNSHPHAGLFQKHQHEWALIKTVPWNELGIFLDQLGMNPNNSQMVLSSVKPREEDLFEYAKQGYLITRVQDYWKGQRFAGMPVKYAKTLGEDRLIEAFYCYKKMKTPSLIIDAGTFVTMDIVTNDGFLGGYIIPGHQAYSKLFTYGEQLKDVSLKTDLSGALPSETVDAMSESYWSFVLLAKKLISDYNLKKLVITGGQSDLWDRFFHEHSPDLIVETNPHLIHWSLQYWMTTQIEIL